MLWRTLKNAVWITLKHFTNGRKKVNFLELLFKMHALFRKHTVLNIVQCQNCTNWHVDMIQTRIVTVPLHSSPELRKVSGIAYIKPGLSWDVSECKQSGPYELLLSYRLTATMSALLDFLSRLQRLTLSLQAPHPRIPPTESLIRDSSALCNQ